ncbi:hypothetical protein C2W64_01620 [Brevibacillus laterosporus]|nr:DUF4183 domain-containing protein [Brevibacillus laterosporus]RAP30424.1 hypothetical protein C2W64_01620 [Brevibacillus laterosporus]
MNNFNSRKCKSITRKRPVVCQKMQKSAKKNQPPQHISICQCIKIKVKTEQKTHRCNDSSSISIFPIVKRFFFVVDSDIHLTIPKIIPAHHFFNDDGEITEKITVFGNRGYINLYINGVLQEGKVYRVSTNDVTIIPTGQTIVAGTPIVVESVGFSAKISQKYE